MAEISINNLEKIPRLTYIRINYVPKGHVLESRVKRDVMFDVSYFRKLI